MTTKQNRVEMANETLCAIASCGRKFFAHDGRVSRFELDHRGRVWFIDKYTQKRIYTHYRYEWIGFSEGGTLRALVERLRDFIATGRQLPLLVFGPWPEWVCGGDLWGYGEDMEIVRGAVCKSGVAKR